MPNENHTSHNGSSWPVWVLVDAEDKVVASARAVDAMAAREVFRHNGLQGVRVRRADSPEGTRCEYCGALITPSIDYRWVGGYERLSRNGAGGTNALRAPDRTGGRFACVRCVDRLAKGVSPHQQALV